LHVVSSVHGSKDDFAPLKILTDDREDPLNAFEFLLIVGPDTDASGCSRIMLERGDMLFSWVLPLVWIWLEVVDSGPGVSVSSGVDSVDPSVFKSEATLLSDGIGVVDVGL
jgi:hypothetical protein